MDPAELIQLLDIDIDMSLLMESRHHSMGLARRMLGPKWHQGVAKDSENLQNKSVLTFGDWKRRIGAQ